jgi:hypothetical protein
VTLHGTNLKDQKLLRYAHASVEVFTGTRENPGPHSYDSARNIWCYIHTNLWMQTFNLNLVADEADYLSFPLRIFQVLVDYCTPRQKITSENMPASVCQAFVCNGTRYTRNHPRNIPAWRFRLSWIATSIIEVFWSKWFPFPPTDPRGEHFSLFAQWIPRVYSKQTHVLRDNE